MTGYKYEFIAEKWFSVEGDGVVSLDLCLFLAEKVFVF